MLDAQTVYVAGHRGVVGSAIVRALRSRCHKRLLARTHAELDLFDVNAVEAFFSEAKPDVVFIALGDVLHLMEVLPDAECSWFALPGADTIHDSPASLQHDYVAARA
jgi:hypothetical protein